MIETSEETIGVQEESVSGLLRDLRKEFVNVTRQEIELAKTEMNEKVSVFGKSAASMLSAGLVLYAGLLFLLASFTFLLHVLFTQAGMPRSISFWLSPLITSAVIGVIGYVLYSSAKKAVRRTSAVPEKTVRTLKEDKEWLTKKS